MVKNLNRLENKFALACIITDGVSGVKKKSDRRFGRYKQHQQQQKIFSEPEIH
jgi:hypothetical protein